MERESPAVNWERSTAELLESGFFDLGDTLAGDSVMEMEHRCFPYYTEYGLDFCMKFAFNPRVLSIIENTLGHCKFGHWLRYEEYPNHIECFRRGGPRAGLRVIMVHIWAKGSQVVYYAGSHKYLLGTAKGRRSLYEISLSEMDRAGCEPVTKEFPDGGLVIGDARLGFEIKSGYAITCLFATIDVVENWVKIFIPSRPGVAGKVAEMESKSDKIGLNFAFEDDKETTKR